LTEKRIIYVVEDDPKISRILADYLASNGHEPRCFLDGRSVVSSVRDDKPAAMILDIMLPASDGMTICREVRKFSDVPILMLTARVEEIDKLKSLGDGADDYVTKPFSAQEVIARVNALIRRAEGRVTNNPVNKTHLIDERGQRIAWFGKWLDLSPSEYRILASMMKQPGRVFSRDQLLDALGEHASESGDRAIDSHIKNIRRKAAAVNGKVQCIASVYGSGYRFALD
tara:strand:- start:2048 stop:2731 length:684 start_codon:yes stop_codon:yes gene_type:complete